MNYLELNIELVIVFIHADGHESLVEVPSEKIILLHSHTSRIPDKERARRSQTLEVQSKTDCSAVPLAAFGTPASCTGNYLPAGPLSREDSHRNCSSCNSSKKAFLFIYFFLFIY